MMEKKEIKKGRNKKKKQQIIDMLRIFKKR